LWNSRGHGCRPARRTIFSNVVRRFTFIHPAGPIAAFRNFSSTTYSAPSGARSKASARVGRSSANRGIVRLALPGWCSVLGDVTTIRPVSQSMSCQRRESTSLGHRRPPKRLRATIARQ